MTTLAFWILFGSALATLWVIWLLFVWGAEWIERLVDRRWP